MVAQSSFHGDSILKFSRSKTEIIPLVSSSIAIRGKEAYLRWREGCRARRQGSLLLLHLTGEGDLECPCQLPPHPILGRMDEGLGWGGAVRMQRQGERKEREERDELVCPFICTPS